MRSIAGLLFGSVIGRRLDRVAARRQRRRRPLFVAMLARTGEVPLGAGEGLAFTADVDQHGRPLIAAPAAIGSSARRPPARLWTLTAYDGDGRLMVNAARRPGFHSREILRRADGSFDIAISPEVQPGNWLPIAHGDGFKLVLRLYDTPLTTGSQLADT